MTIYKAKVRKNIRKIRNIILGCGIVDSMLKCEGKEIYVLDSSMSNQPCYVQTDITGTDRGWFWDGECFESMSLDMQDEDNQI
jgi:hypothetical protein